MTRQFTRVAIINRGEPAVRLILAARELNAEQSRQLTTIALYTDPDRDALFVREADEAYNLGDVWVGAGDDRRYAYTDLELLARALQEVRAEAVWPGWGFVTERPEFVELCDRLGLAFIGPGADEMRRLADKVAAKQLAEQLGLPVAPWSGGTVDSVEQLRAHAERLGYPLMIKAAAGGGGRAIRAVSSGSDLVDEYHAARAEAARLFGDGRVFLETRMEGALHLEVPVIADAYGTVWPLGVRDCTLQRRYQKLVDESPSPVLDAERDRRLQEMALKLVQAANYCGAGCVEFLHDPGTGETSLMAVSARLQVAHPVTEERFSTDLAKLQLMVACGHRLEGDPPSGRGHSIQVRINAEDADAAFAPVTGTVARFRFPGGPGLRVDTGFEEGDAVSADYDSMLAKVVASGSTREEALARLRRTLRRGVALVSRGSTNRGFLLELLQREEVLGGAVDVGWIDRLVAGGEHLSHEHAAVALVKAAIDGYEREAARDRDQFFAWAARGRPLVESDLGHSVELSHRGHSYRFRVFCVGAGHYRLDIDGQSLSVSVESCGLDEQRLTWGTRQHLVRSVLQDRAELVEVDGVPHRIAGEGGDIVEAKAPAVVVSMQVREGDTVATGDPLVVLEAMKSEMTVTASHGARVGQVLVLPNQQVGHGEPLLVLEPLDHGQVAAGGRLQFVRASSAIAAHDTLRGLLLGYDVDAGDVNRLYREGAAAGAGVDQDALRHSEDQLLRIFCDICGLFPTSGETAPGGRSMREQLHRFLRDPDTVEEGLPADFLQVLQRALAHYGVGTLESSPTLRRALFRIYRSHQRIGDQLSPVLAVLQQRLDLREELAPRAPAEFCALLDDIARLTQRHFSAVHDLAREVRYQYFDQPVLERVAADACRRAEEHLRQLVAGEGEVRDHIAVLEDCPSPLRGVLARYFADAPAAARRSILEAFTRRHYRIRELRDVDFGELGANQPVFRATYDRPDGGTVRLLSTIVDHQSGIAPALVALGEEVKGIADGLQVVIDCYARDGSESGGESLPESVAAALERAQLDKRVRRVVVNLTTPGAAHAGMLEYVTFRRGDGAAAFEEDPVYRGLHPMVGKRMDLWRLSEFDISRLPSTTDVYLFHGTARENPRDERLFALAEIRDLTAVRDEQGRLLGIPYLERVFSEALAALRRAQLQRAQRRRLHWNRIVLFVWPVVELSRREVTDLVHRLMPSTAGLGIERVLLKVRIPDGDGGARETVLEISDPGRSGAMIRFREPPVEPMRPLAEYEQKVVSLRQRGLVYPYELIRRLTPSREGVEAAFPPGTFVEYDLDDDDRLLPVSRPHGQNRANVVVGELTSFTAKYPEGMRRIALFGDPSRAMGSLAEPECRRIMAALDLAQESGIPLEWYALSAGAEISMKRGTENMDWISWVLRRIITFTQAGCELNVVVCGINVGAQPYWNAEATMLMHTRGALIMTPESAMVLTGKRSLDYSGGVSAEDNLGIGGYDSVMGPNGQGQYFGSDLDEACQILLRYYDHTYVLPGERFPRRAKTGDPAGRDVCGHPHESPVPGGFATVGDIFSTETNPGRKQPFNIRSVMRACSDQDHTPLERWHGMLDAEIAVVWDAHLGGFPVCMLGIESKPLVREGFVAADGPGRWTSGTLFPMASKKVARAVNAASGNRPLVILANLSGFDGSPESMRNLQLEYGAEIGRAVVNFRGPIVFCVVSRYHGGAFVVFSNKLNENMEVAALEGTYASVIGGAPAAAVVFAREVKKRTAGDPRLTALQEELASARGARKAWVQVRYDQLMREVHSEKLGQVAEEFDGIHSVQRAREVGSVHHIIPPATLRPWLIDAVQRGVDRELERIAQENR